jgi:hypothetical protein
MYNIFKFPSVVAFEDVKAKGGSVFALPKSARACFQARTGPSRVRTKHPPPSATAGPLGVIRYDGMSTFARCPPAALLALWSRRIRSDSAHCVSTALRRREVNVYTGSMRKDPLTKCARDRLAVAASPCSPRLAMACAHVRQRASSAHLIRALKLS